MWRPRMSDELLVTKTPSWLETLVGSALIGLLGGCMWSWAIHTQQHPLQLSLGIAVALLLLILACRRNDLVAGPGQMSLLSFLQTTCMLRWGTIGYLLASLGYFVLFELWVAVIDRNRFVALGMTIKNATIDFLVISPISCALSTLAGWAGLHVLHNLNILQVGIPTGHSFGFTVGLFFCVTVVREILEYMFNGTLHRYMRPQRG
jgi:hypothetical protein